MMITRTEHGKQFLNVKCSDDELKEIVISCIANYDGVFSFKQLCETVCKKLDEQDFLEKEKNTEYRGGVGLQQSMTDKIQQYTWEQIWDKKLMIDLLNDEYRYTPDRTSIRLIKLK